MNPIIQERKNIREKVINPLTGKRVYKDGMTYKRVMESYNIIKSQVPKTTIKLSPKSLSSSKSLSSPKSLSKPNSKEIEEMRQSLPELFDLSFQDFQKMQSDYHRINTILSQYDIVDPKQIKLVKKFIKYIINIPNAKNKSNNSLLEIIESKKYKKLAFKDLPEDIREKILNTYNDMVKTNNLHKWIDESKLTSAITRIKHPGVIDILKRGKFRGNMPWKYLSASSYPEAFELLKQNPNNINWSLLSANPAPGAIKLLKQNLQNIVWSKLSLNPSLEAIELLKQYPDKINWNKLSLNCSQEAIQILEKYPEQIKTNWVRLHRNRTLAAMKLLKQMSKSIRKEIQWDIIYEKLPPPTIEFLLENKDSIEEVYFVMISDKLSTKTFPQAFELMKQMPELIDWYRLSENPAPGAIEILKNNPDEIDWYALSSNPSPAAFDLLKQKLDQNIDPDEIHWNEISSHQSPEAIKFLEENPDKIEWGRLSANPAAIEILRKNQSEIQWKWLSSNPSPGAIELLEKNPTKVDWWELSSNPGAMELLKQYPEKIVWYNFETNPAIFSSYEVKKGLQQIPGYDWDYYGETWLE